MLNEDGLRPNEDTSLRSLMKTAQQAVPDEAKSPRQTISSAGASSLAERLHSFISPARGDFIPPPNEKNRPSAVLFGGGDMGT